MKDKKDEYWKKDKSWIERMRIEFRVKMMKFNNRTHGLGMLFLLMMAVLMIYIVVNIVTTFIKTNDSELKEFEKRVICMQYNTCIWGVSDGL